jgi:peptide/nickel transport system substrate-binding protein
VVDTLVFNFRNPLFQRRPVRTAIARCVPRQQIASELGQAGQGSGQVVGSLLAAPFQPAYRDATPASLTFDPTAARAILQADGWQPGSDGIAAKPLKRLSFRLLRDDSPRAAAAAADIVKSCRQAGIEVVDDVAAGPDSAQRLASGDFDAALEQTDLPLHPSSARVLYGTGGQENVGAYADADTDNLFETLRSGLGDPAADPAVIELDARLWAVLPAVPITQPRTLVAHLASIAGVAPSPTVGGLTWNLATWSVA